MLNETGNSEFFEYKNINIINQNIKDKFSLLSNKDEMIKNNRTETNENFSNDSISDKFVLSCNASMGKLDIIYDQKNDTPMRFDEDDILELLNEKDIEFSKNEKMNLNSSDYAYPETITEYFKVIDVKQLSKKELIIKCLPCLIKNEVDEKIMKFYKIKLLGLWAELRIDPDDKCYISANYNNKEDCYLIADQYYKLENTITEKTYTNKYNIQNNKSNLETIQDRNFEITKNFIIVEPETLISPSTIKTAFPCYRKSIFKENFKNVLNSILNQEMLIGMIVHEVFQTVVRNCSNGDNISIDYIEEKIQKISKNFTLDMALQNIPPLEIEKSAKNYVSNIMSFFKTFFIPKLEKGKLTSIDGLRINKYKSSEQIFQSQVLGMKGVIDMLVETENELKNLEITPLEIKTGNVQSNQDILQVLVYCLILSEQLGKNSYNGILLYLKKDRNLRIKVNQNDIINVIVVRNNIAKLIKQLSFMEDSYKTRLDDLISNRSECIRCFQRDECYFHYVNYEKDFKIEDFGSQNFNSKDDEKNILNLKNYIVDENTKEYFNFFYKLVNDEERLNFTSEKTVIKDFEISDLINFKEYKIIKIESKENSYNMTLRLIEDDKENEKTDGHDDIVSQYEFINDGYQIYEPFNKKFMHGILVNKSYHFTSEITINILKFYVNKYKLEDSLRNESSMKNVFVKNIHTNNRYSFKLMRGNLINICLNRRPRLKELIIEHKNPIINFDNKSDIVNFLIKFYNDEVKNLNLNQKTALFKALLSEDYTLIIGFPGSGKTTLIALLIDVLVKRNKRVLVTAYTNTALDNILLKLKERGIHFVRVTSNPNSVRYELRDKIVSNKKYESWSEWKDFMNSTLVFASTTLGILNKMLYSNEFDYCIVDEACQILEPCIIGPLLYSKRFILVGDPLQLPALVRSIDNPPPSLFERLVDKYPETSVQLNSQYRMNEDILTLSNECVYHNIMKCANSDVANRRLNINLDDYFLKTYPIWVSEILNPDRPVIFVDYMNYVLRNQPNFLNIHTEVNEIEGFVITKLLCAFKDLNFNLNDVGIITPYKAQEDYLCSLFREIDFYNIYTIDKSQGIEKEVIIISFVKNNYRTKILRDIARINVAFTRPKSKLIIIGLIDILKCIEKLGNFVNVLRNKEWIYELDDQAT